MATKTQTKPAARDTGRAVVPSGKGAVSKGGGPSKEILEKMKAQTSARGMSQAQEDNTMPLIYVLQAQSPQVLKKNEKYVEGAEAGDIWLRNASDPIVKGEDGIEFQPCFFNKDWVEWIPRDDGGGYVGRHKDLPGDAKVVDDPKDKNKKRYVSPRGTEYVETRYHGGFVLSHGTPMAFVIPLTSSGHKFSKDWTYFMNSQTMEDGTPIRDSFYYKYKLSIKPMSNNKGDWFGWTFELLDYVGDEQYLEGEKLHEAFKAGIKTMEQPEDQQPGNTNRDM
jgi:hypothetical protein